MPFEKSKNFIQKRKLHNIRVPNALIKNPDWSIGEIQAYVIYQRYNRHKQVTPYRLQKLTSVHHHYNDNSNYKQIFATRTFGDLSIGYWRIVDRILQFMIQAKTDSNLRAKTTIPYEILWSEELFPTEKRVIMLFLMYMELGLTSVTLRKVMDDLGIKVRGDFVLEKVKLAMKKLSVKVVQSDNKKETLLFFDKLYEYPDGSKFNVKRLSNIDNADLKKSQISTKKILYSYNIIKNKISFFKSFKIQENNIKYFVIDCHRKKFGTIVSVNKKEDRSYNIFDQNDYRDIKFIFYRSSLKRHVYSLVIPKSPLAVKFEVSYRKVDPYTFDPHDCKYLDELTHSHWWINEIKQDMGLYARISEEVSKEVAMKIYGKDDDATIQMMIRIKGHEWTLTNLIGESDKRINDIIISDPRFPKILSGRSIEERDLNYRPDKTTYVLKELRETVEFSKIPADIQLMTMVKTNTFMLYDKNQKKKMINELSFLFKKKPSKWLMSWFSTTPVFLITKAVNKVLSSKRKRTSGHLWTKIGKLCCRYVNSIKDKINIDDLARDLELSLDEVVQRVVKVLHPKRFKEIFGEHLTKYFGSDILSKAVKAPKQKRQEFDPYEYGENIRDQLQLV